MDRYYEDFRVNFSNSRTYEASFEDITKSAKVRFPVFSAFQIKKFFLSVAKGFFTVACMAGAVAIGASMIGGQISLLPGFLLSGILAGLSLTRMIPHPAKKS